MTERWTSPDGEANAAALQGSHSQVFDAIAAYDALGHRVLKRVEKQTKVETINEVVAIAFLRRTVTLFAGFRRLVEGSSVEPAKLVLRAHIETLFALRYLVYGGPLPEDLTDTPETEEAREQRARYFRAAALRHSIYRRRAALDGQWESKISMSEDQRKGIEEEIDGDREELEAEFAAENGEFGPLRFDVPEGKKKVYYDTLQWFSFGPGKPATSIRGLAEQVGFLREYHLLYDALSALAHPRDVTQDLVIKEGTVEILHPHTPEAFPILARLCVLFQEVFISTFCLKYQAGSLEDVRAVIKLHRPVLDALAVDIPESFF